MQKYLARRLIQVPITLFFVSIIAFVLIRMLPGDPATAWLGEALAGDQEAYQAMRLKLGLDEPWVVQYGRWMGQILQGDLGISARSRLPVLETIWMRLPVTLELTVLGLLLAVLIAIPLAVISAVFPNSIWDRVATLAANAGLAIPDFWLGILLIYLFAVSLKWLPPSGFVPMPEDLYENARLLILPIVTLGAVQVAQIMRQTRAGLLGVLQQDYVRTARAKGLSELTVIRRHALSNALLIVVTIIGLQTGRLVGAAVVVETIFAMPGLGRLAADSILFRDYSALQGVILVFAIWVLSINLVTDLAYAYLDPRIRLSAQGTA